MEEILKERSLRDRIEDFDLDEDGASLPFSGRLAREQGWTHAETARVIREYKRFLYLAAASGHPVSPSDAVDHAWHLHLLYTRSYWEKLCREVMGFDLHHEPTRGGREESDKFEDWYARTLESYQRLFGEAPPESIWPPPEAERKRSPGVKRWVDSAHYWVVPKWLGLWRNFSNIS